jgi:hypothetical protein
MTDVADQITALEKSIKDAVGVAGIIENNPFFEDIKDCATTIGAIGIDIQTKNYPDLIQQGGDLMASISKMPADYQEFVTDKVPPLTQEANQLKSDTLELCDTMKTQFNDLVKNVQDKGFVGFVENINTLIDDVKGDISSGQVIQRDLGLMIDTLNASAPGLQTQGDVEKASSGLSGISSATDVGDKSPAAPTTPSQPAADVSMGIS